MPILIHNTPVEDYRNQYGLLVKREDLSCPPPGPPFSKTRGVFAHIANRPEKVIGVLDTYHSQAGHAVAQACRELGKKCVSFYPVRKAERGADLKPQQVAAQDLGAELIPLQAGRSAILYHQAKKLLQAYAAYGDDVYMMPNALKLPEMVTETAVEARLTYKGLGYSHGLPETILVAISSGTIASGVIRGVLDRYYAVKALADPPGTAPKFILHMGYDRSEKAVHEYMNKMAFMDLPYVPDITLINEGYSYGDVAKAGETPPWPCNVFYDLKAFRWWLREGREKYGEALLWNIG